MNLAADGAEHLPAAVAAVLPCLLDAAAALPEGRAGVRIGRSRDLTSLLAPGGRVGSIARHIQGNASRPVRAILFDKSARANWSLGWHQDRTICVRERIEVVGFGPWTIKQGMFHVAPPFELLEGMITLRVHLDDVPTDNAPLLMAPGSHRVGRVEIHDIAGVVRSCGQRTCLARAGDVWIYATPILHASASTTRVGRRRVLQVDYAAEELPGGLEWLGV